MKTKEKIYVLLAACFVTLFLYATVGHAATLYVADYGDGTCSLANATSAYNAASDGDTIVFPSGESTWSSTLTIRKPLIIMGAGSGAGGTKLIAGGKLTYGLFYVTGIKSNLLMRITGFYFDLVDYTPFTAIRSYDNYLDNFRIDHNTFNKGYTSLFIYSPKGLVDHNYFYNGNKTIDYKGGNTAQISASWDSMEAGTEKAFFIEDNNFIDDANYSYTSTNERIGTDNGGKLVVRYNHFDSTKINAIVGSNPITPIMTHGGGDGYWQPGGSGRRAVSVLEFYNNIIEGKKINWPVVARGSANLIYNNTITQDQKNYCKFYFYEEEYYDSADVPFFRNEWPAEDQVHNTFIWNNTYNGNPLFDVITGPTNSSCTASGTPMPCCTGKGTGTCDGFYLKKDRDYFLHAPCGVVDKTDAYGNPCTHGKAIFTGKNGASGSYPTDGGKFPTLGTMVFIPTGDNAYYGYKPYTYPHLLTVAAPTPAAETTPPPPPASAMVPPPPPAPAPDYVPPPEPKKWWRFWRR